MASLGYVSFSKCMLSRAINSDYAQGNTNVLRRSKIHNESSNSQLRLTDPASSYIRPDLPAWFLALLFRISLSFLSVFMILFCL